MVVDRTRPFWHDPWLSTWILNSCLCPELCLGFSWNWPKDAIAPFLLSGKTPLVVAHEGSVRAPCQIQPNAGAVSIAMHVMGRFRGHLSGA